MIIATFNSADGKAFEPFMFVQWMVLAGTISKMQVGPLCQSLQGHDPLTLHVEKIGQKLWVTLLSQRKAVWTWSIGPRGKSTSPNIDTSEADMSLIEALNTQG